MRPSDLTPAGAHVLGKQRVDPLKPLLFTRQELPVTGRIAVKPGEDLLCEATAHPNSGQEQRHH